MTYFNDRKLNSFVADGTLATIPLAYATIQTKVNNEKHNNEVVGLYPEAKQKLWVRLKNLFGALEKNANCPSIHGQKAGQSGNGKPGASHRIQGVPAAKVRAVNASETHN